VVIFVVDAILFRGNRCVCVPLGDGKRLVLFREQDGRLGKVESSWILPRECPSRENQKCKEVGAEGDGKLNVV